MSGAEIVRAALAARTVVAAAEVNAQISIAVGSRHQRPVGDRWNNSGLLTASGTSYDHKILEAVTNMQDAVIERLALQKYGSRARVPFRTPREAAADLLGGLDYKDQAELATVELAPADEAEGRKRITAIFRDSGCGMTPHSVPKTIFQLGSGHKDGCDWLQGNYGLGGATTFRNAEAVVLVTRRDPSLLAGEPDRITVAVVQWERERTTDNAFYLVNSPWSEAGDVAPPYHVLAAEVPEFTPGTYLALISYGTEGLGRRSGDERAFDMVFNTRLFSPIMPIRYKNEFVRDRPEYLRGLERRLDDNPPANAAARGKDVLPFTLSGKTYHLPIRYRIFEKGDAGSRRRFLAYDHAVIITSNGQVHAHWSPSQFKMRTRLKRLYDRVLIAVDCNALPLEFRTDLFTADRSQMVRKDPAIRLEQEIAAFVDEWSDLVEFNHALIRESITSSNDARPTIQIAQKISRAMKIKGFSVSGAGKSGGGKKPPRPSPPEDLYEDPTHFEGPASIEAALGKARGVYFKLNAKDGFIDRRAELIVTCDHPDIGADEITVGQLSRGRVRVSVLVPEDAVVGKYTLSALIDGWVRSSGGVGARFEWICELTLLAEEKPPPPSKDVGGGGDKQGSKGAGQEGGLVAVIWDDHENGNRDDWDAHTVGDIEQVAGAVLAERREEYAELKGLETEVPTIMLNASYRYLKEYVHAAAEDLTDEGREGRRDRYAVGIGVALLILDQRQKRDEAQRIGSFPDDVLREAQRAAARGVLSVLPDYDLLYKEIEIGD